MVMQRFARKCIATMLLRRSALFNLLRRPIKKHVELLLPTNMLDVDQKKKRTAGVSTDQPDNKSALVKVQVPIWLKRQRKEMEDRAKKELYPKMVEIMREEAKEHMRKMR